MLRKLAFLIPLSSLLYAETASVDGSAGGVSDSVDITIIVDSDRDGLTDTQEADLGTNPNNPDSDGDGLSDFYEASDGNPTTDPNSNQFISDPDWGAIPTATNDRVRAFWDFESYNNGFASRKGNFFASPVPLLQSVWNQTDGMLGKSAKVGGSHYLQVPPNNLWTSHRHWTVAASLKFSAIPNAAAVLPLFSIYAGTSVQSNEAPALQISLIRGAPLGPAVGNKLFFRVHGSEGNFAEWILPAEEKLAGWVDVVFAFNGQYSGTNGVNRHCYVNGEPIPLNLAQGVGYAPANGPAQHAGGYILAGATKNTLGVVNVCPTPFSIDRWVISGFDLSDLDPLANPDSDGDGMSNRQELAKGFDPYKFENDIDRDGLTNIEETAGQAYFGGVLKVFGPTNPNNFDSDGDLFDDYWEAKFYRPGFVDPNDGAVPVDTADDDGDGLTNWEELLNGTSPVARDTNGNSQIDQSEIDASRDTDGDGISDADEANFGSNPLDGAEKPLDYKAFYGAENLTSFTPIGNLGVTLKAGSEDSPYVYAQVGDPSDSKSERWRLVIGKKQLLADDFGKLSDGNPATPPPAEEPTPISLNLQSIHKITLEHVGTAPGKQPDFDYRATVEPAPQSPFILADLGPDGDPLTPDGLLGNKVTPGVTTDQSWRYKTAYLVPLDNFSWATSYSGGDAVGPRHRKVALNGRPMPDEKPQQEEESDLPDEQTYVDAFNLSLNHDTSFAYTPLGASDLALQATMSAAETGFTDRSGLRPHERFDLPFGPGWSSNLCSYVEVIETIGGETTDPITVNVVDEAGRPQRFGTVDFRNFFPWPSTRVDKKTYLNTLSRNGERFVLEKKYGNTLTFQKAQTWFMYSTDRLDGSTQVKRHTYWRLTEARDRYGVRLHYTYDEPGVPNEVSLIPHKISSPDRPNQFLIINRTPNYRQVDEIIDSRGNKTTFHYDNSLLTFNGFNYSETGAQGNPVSDSGQMSRLASVTYADGTSTQYSYSGGLEREIDASDPENPRATLHYHINLSTITDKRGNTHGFEYAFDHSKQFWDSSVNGSFAAVDLDLLPNDVKAYVEQEIAERNEPGKGSWKTMFGMSRRLIEVTLPGSLGSSTFQPQGSMRFGQTVTFPTPPGTTVTDALGNVTIYEFNTMEAEIVDIDATSKSVSAEWMVYYLTSKIHHYQGTPANGTLLGSEIYEFDKTSGLSLWRSTDFSGNITTWEYGNPLPEPVPGLGKFAASQTMTRWADPTAKIDALGRRESYEYEEFRVMSQIHDPYGTVTTFHVDSLGRRTSKTVQNGDPLAQERYEYNNQRFRAFQTATIQLAFANLSGQPWETDLVTRHFPDDRGRLWREIVDPTGLKLTTEHTYDFNNNKTSTLDPRGNRTRFKYDALNRLIEVTHPSAGTRSGTAVTTKKIWYDLNGNKAADIDEEGHFTIYHYDSLNRRIRTIRDMDEAGLPTQNAKGLVEEANKGTATGNDIVTERVFDAVNNLTHSIDPSGRVTYTVFDSLRRPIHVFSGLTMADAADLTTAIAAAAASTEKTHTEFRYTDVDLSLPVGGLVKGNSGSTAFDSSGFKPTVILRHDAHATATDTTATLATYAAYDALYRPVRTETQYEPSPTDYAVASTTYGTISGGKEALQTTNTDARGKVTTTLLDGLQRPIQVIDDFGGLAAETRSFYSSTGLVWKTIDPEGRETETEYDAAARPVCVWQPDPITGLVNRATPNDPLLGSPRTRTAYDANGNVTVSINPLGFRWEYEYDARNRKTLERLPTVTATEIVAGLPQQSPLLNPVVRTAYDAIGNVISITDARGHITRSFHDRAYRVTHVLSNPVTGQPATDPATPGTHDVLVQTDYDASGNALKVIDGNGNATRNAYDRLNRLVATATNPNDGNPNAPPATPKPGDIVVSNGYDDAGNLVKVTDGQGHITGFRYDGLARKTRTIWDEGSSVERIEQASFDGLVQLSRTDPLGRVTTYQYDGLHRLEDVLYAGAATDNRHYDYDLVGNLREVSYPNESPARQLLRGVSQDFDALNRLTEETSAGKIHVHTYDKAGNRRSTIYAATGRTLVSTYDKLNRLLTLTEGSAVTRYAYDRNGNITRKVHANGTETRCTFDAFNRKLSENTLTVTGAVVSAFDYSQAHGGYPSGYDHVGNVLKVVEQYGHANVEDRTVTNLYDRTYRLKTETIVESGGDTTLTGYDYDNANNRSAKTVTVNGGTAEVWTFTLGSFAEGDSSNQIKSVSDGTTTTTFLYDLNGNRSEKQVGGVTTQTYTYDHENRLIAVVDAVKGSFAYAYDHRTRRVLRDEQGSTGVPPVVTTLSFAGGLSVQEYQGDATTPAVETIRGSDYGGGIGGVLYTIRGSTRSHNAYNSRGDVVSQTNESAIITWQAAYEAFGTRTQEEGATADRQKANTKDEDPTGLLNEGMRYRDLEFGIFLTRDPAGFVDGPNVYTYVRQNPWTFFDPLGLATIMVDDPKTEKPPLRDWLDDKAAWEAETSKAHAARADQIHDTVEAAIFQAQAASVKKLSTTGQSDGFSVREAYNEAALQARKLFEETGHPAYKALQTHFNQNIPGLDKAKRTAEIVSGLITAAFDAAPMVLDGPLPFGDAAAVGGSTLRAGKVALAAKGTAGAGDEMIDVYRVFGGDARAQGFSWTTVDPRTVSNFRNAAGLPSGGASGATNTADFLIQGQARASDIIKSRAALPLDGNVGGLPELIIDPKNVKLFDFSILNP